MAGSKVASRYAKGFLGLAAEKNQLDAVVKDMELIIKTAADSKELVLLIKSPVIKADKKTAILKTIFEKHVSELTMLFIALIAKNRRESVLVEIAEAVVGQYKVLKGITTASVTSATELSNDVKKRIEKIVQDAKGGTVELTAKVDETLIGGFVLRIGDKQLDTSIATKINDLKKELIK